jgi:hypothetical protein
MNGIPGLTQPLAAAGKRIDHWDDTGGRLRVSASSSVTWSICPKCAWRSHRLFSWKRSWVFHESVPQVHQQEHGVSLGKARLEGALSGVKRERIQGCSPWPVLCLAVVVGFRVNCEQRCGSSAPSPGSPTYACAARGRAAWSLRPPSLPTHSCRPNRSCGAQGRASWYWAHTTLHSCARAC